MRGPATYWPGPSLLRPYSYPDSSLYGWDYEITGPDQLTPLDPYAPEWSWEAWRESLDADRTFAEQIERSVRSRGNSIIDSLFVPRSPEAGAEYQRLCAECDARIDVFDRQLEQLEALKQREWSAYGLALARSIEKAAQTIPGCVLPCKSSFARNRTRTWGLQSKAIRLPHGYSTQPSRRPPPPPTCPTLRLIASTPDRATRAEDQERSPALVVQCEARRIRITWSRGDRYLMSVAIHRIL